MSTDRDVTRIVRSWMDEGVNVLPDRVLDAVLDQLPATPQRPAWWPTRRFPTMNTYARLGFVAAAIVLATVVGVGLFARSGVGGPPPGPSPSPPPQINGIYHTSFTRADLTASPFITRGEINDGNWGDWTLTFLAGRVSYTQRNSVTSSSSSGTFTINGDAITMVFDTGANVGETFRLRWHLTANELTFTRDDTLGVGPTPLLVKPWSRR